MKRLSYIFLSVAAVLGCTKTGVEYDAAQIGEIVVSPVAGKITKAAIADGVFPEGNHIGLFAYYTSEIGAGTVTDYAKFTTEFFNNIEFHCEAGSKTWDGLLSDYYWPTTGSLVFAGYSLNAPEEGQDASAKNGTPEYDLKNDQLKITGYVQPHETDKTYDLLYFGRTPQSYDKNAISVPIVFRHALAWIEIQVKGGAGSLIGGRRTWRVTKVEFRGVDCKGDFTYSGVPVSGQDTEDVGSVTWKTETPNNIVVFNSKPHTDKDPVMLTDKDQVIENVSAGTLVLPQAADKLYVTIEYASPAGADIEEVVEIDIPASTPVWEAGKKYTYRLTFSPQEILVAPTVEVWPDPVIADMTF